MIVTLPMALYTRGITYISRRPEKLAKNISLQNNITRYGKFNTDSPINTHVDQFFCLKNFVFSDFIVLKAS